MRNALILLLVVAALILVVGGVNHGVAFDVEYVAGTMKAVSFFWVAAVVAGIVFVVGAVAAWLAQAATVTSRRKLEAELQSTYERLREAEALAARPAPAVAPATPVVVAVAEETAVRTSGQTAVTTVAAAEAADGESEEETRVAEDLPSDSAVTGSASPEVTAVTVVASDPDADVADADDRAAGATEADATEAGSSTPPSGSDAPDVADREPPA